MSIYFKGSLSINIDEELLVEVKPHFSIHDNGMTEDERKVVEAVLKKSLENGKTFYANAPEYIRASMREYEQLLHKGVVF